MNTNDVNELLSQAEEAIANNDKKNAGKILYQILDQNINNDYAWKLLYQVFESRLTFKEFQADLAKRYFSSQSHLLISKSVSPSLPPLPDGKIEQRKYPAQQPSPTHNTQQTPDTFPQSNPAQPIKSKESGIHLSYKTGFLIMIGLIVGCLILTGLSMIILAGLNLPLLTNNIPWLSTTKTLPGTQISPKAGIELRYKLLKNGEIIFLKNLGNEEVTWWLDGHTNDGTVGMSTSTDYPYTGTKWQVYDENDDGIFSLKSLGHLDGYRWLDGRTDDGTVGLALSRGTSYSGVNWEIINLGNQIYTLRCLGEKEGPHWLEGNTKDSTVNLVYTTIYPFTGTHWAIIFP